MKERSACSTIGPMVPASTCAQFSFHLSLMIHSFQCKWMEGWRDGWMCAKMPSVNGQMSESQGQQCCFCF